MEQKQLVRTCPECGSGNYVFRGRRKVTDEQGQEAVETKYCCRTCGHEWKVRATVNVLG